MQLWKPAALFGVILLIGAACGSGTESAVTADAAIEPTSGAESTQTTVTSDGGEASDGEPQTLDEYLGLAANIVRGGGGGPGGGRTFDEDQALEQQQLVQQEIQLCMQAQGFVYMPEEVGDGLRFFLATQQGAQGELEYAQTEGFGISTRFDFLIEGDVDLTESTSPNDEHVATLSEGEADAWQFALRGAAPQRNEQGQLIDPETGEVLQGRQAQGGCTGAAQETVRGDAEALADLAQSFDELEERIEADPRITEIGRAWSDCMRTDGFDFQDVSEARAEINQEFRPLLRSFFQSTSETGQQAGPGQGQGNPLQAIAGLELTSEQEVQLRALQDRERAMAVASLECQGDTADEVAEITARYEAEFIDANRAELEAIAG